MRFAISIALLVGTGVGTAQGPIGPAATFVQTNRTQWDGIFTAAQANRGAPLFEEHCVVCHGGGLAPDLFGSEFNARWDGYSIGEMFSLVQTAMPQQQPGSLAPQQYTDIVAYLLHGGGFPAGQEPLQSDADTLGQITFVATRPPPSP
jgi:quinoprotein glucose dehydrogenase